MNNDLDVSTFTLPNEPGRTVLSLETWSGDALPRAFLKLGGEQRELTAEEALDIAEKLMAFGLARSAADGAKARKEIAGFIFRLSKT